MLPPPSSSIDQVTGSLALSVIACRMPSVAVAGVIARIEPPPSGPPSRPPSPPAPPQDGQTQAATSRRLRVDMMGHDGTTGRRELSDRPSRNVRDLADVEAERAIIRP